MQNSKVDGEVTFVAALILHLAPVCCYNLLCPSQSAGELTPQQITSLWDWAAHFKC